MVRAVRVRVEWLVAEEDSRVPLLALVFFGLDIPANKVDTPLFREAIRLTKKSKLK